MGSEGEVDALLDAGSSALREGRWAAAREAFATVLAAGEHGEAQFGLGVSRWWLGDTPGALRCWGRAYATFRRTSDPDRAVVAAIYSCLAYRMSLGNHAAASGWLGRAATIVGSETTSPMAGWVLLCRAYLANESGHPQAAEPWAREALELARRRADADLELWGESELGAALVGCGRRDQGGALLDQAMAGALAQQGGDLDTVVLVSCRTVTTCSRAADVKRAAQWIRAADEFNRRYGSTHLNTTCRVHQGAILFAIGRWDDAERELRAALAMSRTAEPALHAEARAELAELRLAQGRVDDAARLLAGYEDLPETAPTRAAIHLARQEPAVAVSVLRRRLGDLDQPSIEWTEVFDLLVEAQVDQGAVDELTQLLRQPATIPAVDTCPLALAHHRRAVARALIATDEATAAVPLLEQALAAFTDLELPLHGARTRVLLARALLSSDPATSIAEGRAALAAFESLGAARDADGAAGLLRSLGVRAARRGPRGLDVLSTRERQVLALLGEGMSNPEIARRLFIARKTAEHHVASVLTKLGLSGRAEAAAYAVRHLDPRPPETRTDSSNG